MDIRTLRRIVTAFADEPIDVDIVRGTLVAQIREEIVEANVIEREGTLWVREFDRDEQAYKWILRRIARLDLLADKIVAQLGTEEFYVEPEGAILHDLEETPGGEEAEVTDAATVIEQNLQDPIAGVTKVLYLTSDAGEGKTTLINHVARGLAFKYKQGKNPWLLVPISLGGRPFMALDDIVVAELTNRYRFPLYYDAFTELVRLNAIVPALDGFEEVFLETGSGEAASALGNLINQLNGSGRVLIAARKAYFEVRSFASQSRMFDTIGEDAGASFERLSLHRWSKEKFCEYARIRGLDQPEALHSQISDRLRDSEHPLLTRAVLVARLVEVALEGDIQLLLESLAQDPEDYFFQFVGALVAREANTKWIDRSQRGDAASPLLSVDEHIGLLTQVAREMWINKTDALRTDYIDLVADVFSSDRSKPAAIAQQIKERLHQHSLLVTRGAAGRKLAFDHEDFRLFFLGQALGSELVASDPASLGAFLRTSPLPLRTVEAAISFISREGADPHKVLEAVVSLGRAALDTSYEKENAGLLAIRLLEKVSDSAKTIDSLSFPPASLEGRRLGEVLFKRCRFQATPIGPSSDWEVTFHQCSFERIEISSECRLNGITFDDCEISSVLLVNKEESHFGPEQITSILRQAGAIELHKVDGASESTLEIDIETKLAEQALRAFMRATHLNENVFRQRLGQNANEFFDSVLPALIEAGVLKEVEYRGAGVQRRFKLSAPMRNIEPAIRNANDLTTFIALLKENH